MVGVTGSSPVSPILIAECELAIADWFRTGTSVLFLSIRNHQSAIRIPDMSLGSPLTPGHRVPTERGLSAKQRNGGKRYFRGRLIVEADRT